MPELRGSVIIHPPSNVVAPKLRRRCIEDCKNE